MAKSPQAKDEKRLKTLERVFSKAGLGSRTDARSWIGGGRVRVNSIVIQNPDHWVDLDRDHVTLDNEPLVPREKTYILLYKPTGYLTTYRDPEKRPTVYDLLAGFGEWLSPVGRLDLDSSGLLLMTNDTDLGERLTNPEHKIPKTYQVKAATVLTDEQLDRLRNGVELSDGPTRPAEVTRIRENAKYTHLEITITEGRNRQVRRMLEAVDSKVLKLVRIGIGPIRIGDLQIGKWRQLSDDEVVSLGGVKPTSSKRDTPPARAGAPARKEAPTRYDPPVRGAAPARKNVPLRPAAGAPRRDEPLRSGPPRREGPPPRRDSAPYGDRPPRRDDGPRGGPPRREGPPPRRDSAPYGDRPPRRDDGPRSGPPRPEGYPPRRDSAPYGDRPPRRDDGPRSGPPRREDGPRSGPPRREGPPPRRDGAPYRDRPPAARRDGPQRRDDGPRSGPPRREGPPSRSAGPRREGPPSRGAGPSRGRSGPPERRGRPPQGPKRPSR